MILLWIKVKQTFVILIFSFLSSLFSSHQPANSPKNKSNISDYSVEWLKVENSQNVFLFSNLEEKLTAKEALAINKCSSLINAGFYTKEKTPIGLFIGQNKKYLKRRNSLLFNGFIYKINGEISISTSPPDNTDFTLQSGPLFIINSTVKNLTIDNDREARRVIAATDTANNLYFLIMYKESSNYLGPKLTEVGNILLQFQQKNSLHLKAAINLDGGSASAFLTDNSSFTEISSIGSYFCIK